MFEHNGEKYFIVDGHCHFWDASPANWKPGAEQYAKGWIECFHAYMGLGPPETHWPLEKFQKYSEDDFVKDVFEGGGAEHVDPPVHVPEGVVHDRLQHGGEERHAGREVPRQADRQRSLGSPRGRGRASSSSRRTPSVTTSRAPSSTRPSGTTARADGRSPTSSASRSTRSARSSGSRTSTSTRARRSGRWTRTRSTSRTSTSPRP